MDKYLSVALCCIVKRENEYLDEYVNYYHDLGFSHIYIYDNNDIDGEKPEDIIGKYDFVSILDCRGKKVQQLLCYESCYKNYHNKYDWMAFYDADEFLTLKNDKTIQQYLSREAFKKYDCVDVCWVNYDDSNLIGYENNYERSQLKRFHQISNDHGRDDGTSKMVIRCNTNEIKFLGDPHHCNITNKIKDTNFAIIKHFRRTIIEFIEHKFGRGWATLNKFPIDYNWFLLYSKDTPVKRKIYDTFVKTGKIIIPEIKEPHIAIQCHVYHEDIWYNDIKKRLLELPYKFDLYISTTDNINRNTLIEDVKHDFNGSTIILTPNLGEDMRGFFASLEYIFSNNKNYDWVLKIHTKHETTWRTSLLDALLSFNDFDIDKQFVFAKRFTITINKLIDCQYIPEMTKMIGCTSQQGKFCAGSMFWMRYDLCEKYFKNKLKGKYFDEPYCHGRSKQHSCERLFGCIAHENGDKIEYVDKPSNIVFTVKTPKPSPINPFVVAPTTNGADTKKTNILEKRKIIKRIYRY